MIRKFIVSESSNSDYLNELFEAEFRLKKNIPLPFTEDEYRCTMFDGVKMKLVKDEEYIIAVYLQ
jgi:hypothetical protein